MAFRYHLPSQNGLSTFTIQHEVTHFQLPENSLVWANYHRMQTRYEKVTVEEVKSDASRPLVFRTEQGVYAALLEANVDNYSRMMLDKAKKKQNTLVSSLEGSVQGEVPFATSWKLILVGDTPGQLLEHNYLVLNLTPPSQYVNTDWIKPGKMMREMTLSTEGGKKYVDFAADHNIQYILYDGGWYGDPIVDQSDARTPAPWERKIRDIENHGGLNLQEVIDYGKTKDVGVFLYLDRRVLERRMDYLLPRFREWGVKGLKFGFVKVGTQAWSKWLHNLVERCADYQLMVNVHDEYYPTGMSRTLPNLLSQEGILGNEEMPEANHNVTLAFTRMLAGAADYTPAYYKRREFGNEDKHIKTSPAHQLALPVIYYSPLKSIFWYDQPQDYQGEPEVEFWEKVPTTWDETKVLKGEMGEYIVVARRSQSEWYVAGITDDQSRELEISLDFLSDKSYVAKLYYDDEEIKTRTQVGIKELDLQPGQTLTIPMKASGGFALRNKTKTTMRKNNLEITGVVLVIICYLSACNSTTTTNEKHARKTNIIYILANDLGYGDLGSYGQQLIQPPQLDQMSTEGLRFTNHYAGNAVCAPSRYNLLTGLHPGHASIRGNGCNGGCSMPDEDKTIAEYLKQAGYVTGIIGKWSNGQHGTGGFPTRQGFDFFYGYDNQILAHNYWPEYLWRNNKKEYLSNEVQYLDTSSWHIGLGSYSTRKNEYAHDLFAQEAKKFINQHQDTSFFLYVPFTIPHNNGEAPAGQKQEIPDYGIYTNQDWQSDSLGYAAMITRMDTHIGELLDLLEQLGIDENTLVIFDSDNGSMQERLGFTKFFDSNGSLKGGKRELYEGGIRVPMVAWWPGTIEAGQTTDHITAAWDFLPTACDLAGLDAPSPTDGISFLPLLTQQPQPTHDFLYWEYGSYGGQQAVRMGNWKGIRQQLEDNPTASLEVYNLAEDPSESENIADEHPKIVKKMSDIIKAEHQINDEFLLSIDTITTNI